MNLPIEILYSMGILAGSRTVEADRPLVFTRSVARGKTKNFITEGVEKTKGVMEFSP